jgi:outer membrane protein assembly factor BamB
MPLAPRERHVRPASASFRIVTNGVVYLQDLGGNVYALDLATGRVKWEYQVSSKIVAGGPDGVAVADGVVYGDTTTPVGEHSTVR